MSFDLPENAKNPFLNSKGSKKLHNYFLNIIERDDFQQKVSAIREAYGIDTDKVKGIIEEERKLFFNRELGSKVSELALHYGFDPRWSVGFYHYVTENKITQSKYMDLCSLYQDGDKLPEDVIRMKPVFIRISPYASKRDILDFITRMYPEISKLQKSHQSNKIEIGKFKTKNHLKKERDNFIYEHRDLPSRQIMSLLGDKFGKEGIIDQGHIGKVISQETKRRKGV